MEKLTFKDIKYILDELHDRRSSRFMWDYFLDNQDDSVQLRNDSLFKRQINPDFKALTEQLGNFSCIYNDDNERSGYGEIPVKYVYYFVNHDVYIQFQGWYASHSGSEYSEMFEVKPEQVLVTKYEPV